MMSCLGSWRVLCALLFLHGTIAQALAQTEQCLLHGTIVGADNGPLEGIRIVVEDADGRAWEMLTGEGGRYGLVLPAPGRYRLTVHLVPPLTVPVHVQPGDFMFALDLGGLPTLTGVVKSAGSGRVEPDALVVAVDDAGDRWETRADKIGFYRLYLPPGQYRIGVHRPSDDMATVTVSQATRAVADISDRSPHGTSDLFGFARYVNGRFGVDLEVIAEDEAGNRRTTRTTKLGNYAFTELPAGRYAVTVKVRPPFDPVVRTIDIAPWQDEAPLDIILDLRKSEEIRVLAEGSAAIRAEGTVGAAFSREELDQLPLTNARTLQSLVSLAPGVVVTESVGTLAQFTSTGQRRYANRLSVDGLGADLAIDVRGLGIGEAGSGALPASATSGGTQTIVPLDAIEQVQVRTTNASSAHARTPGAQTAIVTRSGGDRLAGSAFADVRPSALAASSWFDNANRTERHTAYRNFGASLGGPLVLGRAYFFSAFERQRIDRPLQATVPVPSLSLRDSAPPALRPILDAFPQPNGRELAGGLAESSYSIPAASALSSLSVRIDTNISAGHRLFARANIGDSRGDALTSTRQLPFYSFGNSEDTATRTVTLGLTSAFSSSTHELRINATAHRGRLTAGAAEYGGAQALPLDLLAPGGSAGAPWVRLNLFPGPGGFLVSGRTGSTLQKQFQVADAWTLLRGPHEWQAGLEFRRVDTESTPAPDRYTYNFLNLGSMLQGQVRFVTLDHLEPALVRRDSWAAYVQDTFRILRKLSLNYGIRYGVRPAPTNLSYIEPLVFRAEAFPQLEARPRGEPLWKTSWKNIAPRAAASYRLSENSALSAGWNLVFDELTQPGAAAFGRGYPYVTTRTIRPASFPVSPGVLTVGPPPPFAETLAAEAYALPSNLRSPRTHEWQVGFDQAFGSANRLSLSYVGAAGRDLVYWSARYLDEDHPIQTYDNSGTSDYHALLAEFVRRASRNLQGKVAYAWSHAIDLDSGENLGPNPPTDIVSPNSNRGSADFDRRHVLRVMASYQVPTPRLPRVLEPLLAGWQIDAVGIVMSGAPVSVTLGNGLYPQRPDVVPGIATWLVDPTAPTGRRIDPRAFTAPEGSPQGTLGRNTLHASTVRQVDLALSRSIRIGERVTVQLRLDAFNVCNVANFGPPLGNMTATEFGRPNHTYAEALGTGTLAQGGLTPIQQTGGPRSIQFGMRLKW